MLFAGSERRIKLRPRDPLAAFRLDKLLGELPAPTVETIGNRGFLSLKAQAALALLVGGDTVISDKFPVMRWHLGWGAYPTTFNPWGRFQQK